MGASVNDGDSDDIESDDQIDAEIDDDLADELDDDLDEDLDEELVVADDLDAEDDDDDEDEDDDDKADVPARRRRATEEEDDEEELDPDDVEADLDTILKDRIASGDDLDDEEEEGNAEPDRTGSGSAVAAKQDGEFTCTGCFMIVHPRQFGRKGARVCPEGFDDCPSIPLLD